LHRREVGRVRLGTIGMTALTHTTRKTKATTAAKTAG
jgi:hypothetical protein